MEHAFAVTVAVNGEDGLEKAVEQDYNIILLDLIMPRIDGFAFLERRQLSEQLKQIPVIVFSTLGQEEDIEKAKALGASDYVNKSFLDFEGLLLKITSVMKS